MGDKVVGKHQVVKKLVCLAEVNLKTVEPPVYVFDCMYMCMHICMYTCTHVCMYRNTYTHINVYVCVYT